MSDPSSPTRSRTLRSVLIGIVACEGIGALAGWLTRSSVETWYPTLAKPWFTPPDWVFPPTWILLYAMMGVAVALVVIDRTTEPRRRRMAGGLFGLQLALNVLWTVGFFRLQSPDVGLVVIAALWLAIAGTIERFARIRAVAAWLLVPYLLWVSYAAALNVAIVQLN